jgi:uncharacterized membrane protein
LKRRRTRRPARDLDDFDFEWVLVPWDATLSLLASAYRALGAGLKAAWKALRTERPAQLFAVLFVLALLARLWRPDWYAHNTFHPDERWIFDKTAELSYPGEPGKTDPAGMQYGSLPFYVVATAKDVATHALHMGAYDASILCGRTITGCVDALTVLAVLLTAWQLLGAMPALLAALFIACAPLNIQLAHFFTVDPWLACFATFTLAACVRLARRPGTGVSVLVGILYAAALASKSSGLPLLAPITLAHLWPALTPGLGKKERAERLRRAGLGLAAAAAATLAAFFVFMPWAFLNFSKFKANQTAQQEILVTGSPNGTPFVRQYWDTSFLFHLKNIIFFYLGLPTGLLALLAVPGLAYVAGRDAWRAFKTGPLKAAGGRARSAAAHNAPWDASLGPLLLLAWLLPYVAIVGFSFAKFARYMLPALPALAVLLAAGLVWLAARTPRLARVLGFLCVLCSLGYGSGYFLTYFHEHPWLETSEWTYAHIPPMTADPTAPGGQRRTRILNEDWGDDLPVPVGNHYSNYDSLKDRPGQMNVVEWDTASKLGLMCNSLSQTDVIYLADPRAYGTYLRIPHRFPLTHAYYHLLFSDPARLGFALVHESSNPIKLFGLIPVPDSRIPSVPRWLWADESFTLYDRPHAFVFQRVAPMTPDQVRQVLMQEVQSLGLSQQFMVGRSPDELQAESEGGPVVYPGQANVLPPNGVNVNYGRDRGSLFALGNAALAPLTWWFLVSVLGWLAFPLTLRLFRGFPAGGYALSRTLGVFLFGWLAYNLAWALPRLMPFWQSRLWLLMGAGAALGAWAVHTRRKEAVAWLKAMRGEILFTEAVFAGAFLFFVLVRLYNPNIHDTQGQGYFGGGEPLGMTYLSAVSRCATFPAFDPWLALANSSYYYFGYVLAATLTKLSGFEPAITYNLSLALFFSLTLLTSFGLLRALVSKRWLALGGAAMVAMAGSLWSVAFIALQTSRGSSFWGALFNHGFIWDPTRYPELVSGHIFEFPFFSYLYGDLHPHNIVLGFSLLLAALLLKPFLAKAPSWRALGGTPIEALLWFLVVALLLDAQYAINTWSWPIFVALGAVCVILAPWTGKGLGVRPLQVLAWAAVFALLGFGAAVIKGNILALVGIPGWMGPLAFLAALAGMALMFIYGGGAASLLDFAGSALALLLLLAAGPVLMFAFRHYYLQNGANRVGTVQPSEWQMSAYIPLAYFLPGLVALAALGGARVHGWALSLAKPLGWERLKAKRGDWVDKAAVLGERYLGIYPVSSVALIGMKLVMLGLVVWASVHWEYQGVWALSLSLGLACLVLLFLGGYASAPEAFLWVLGACFCLMVAGVEFKFVADRMNTIFKVWMNGWVFMGLVFAAGLAPAFESQAAPARALALPKRGRRRGGRALRLPSGRILSALAALALVVLVAGAAAIDARLMGRGGRFIASYLAFGLLLAAVLTLGAWYGQAAWWSSVRQGLFFGLLGLGLLYPFGATLERIEEASQFSHPHLNGLSFMAERDARFSFNDKDYDKHDYALINWINQHVSVTETLVEAPGTELYKGYDRYSIYTGLPTLLGWDYQVSQQLGERTGNTLEQRKQDARVIYGPDDAPAVALLKQYHARWIVVGSLERQVYPGPGLDKFGHLATLVAQDGNSMLYRFDWDKP